jgi:DNA-binding IclR family transcriptional regulator
MHMGGSYPVQNHLHDASSGTQSIERAFAVLREVKAANRSGITIAALAGKLRLNRTTTHRIVKCLIEQGAVRREAERIVLGAFAFELGVAARQPQDLKTLFSPGLTRIAEQTGDTVFLVVRSGNDAVCVDRRSGSYPVKTLVVEVGTRRPLGVGAGSIAMLSALGESELQQIVGENTRALKNYSIAVSSLLKSVAMARRAGYASTRVQGVDGVIAIGVPIRDPDGVPIASASMAALEKRMTRVRQLKLKDLLAEEATALTERLRGATE